MGQYVEFIVYGLIIVTVLMLFQGAYMLLSSGAQNERIANKRLKQIKKTGDTAAAFEILKKSKRQGSLFDSIFPNIRSLLWSANVGISPTMFFAFSVGLAFLAIFIGFNLNMGIVARLLLFAFALLGPFLFLRVKASRRQKKFADQLVGAIDLISRGLQAGHPAAVAMEMVSNEMPDPIGSEFGLVIDEINYGLDRDTAMKNMADRFPNDDLRFFISALSIQKETGGNLVEVLENLSNIIRLRREMKKKVWALSAEGRASAFIVGAMPLVMFLIISLMNPTYYVTYADDIIFKIGMTIPAVLYVLGMYWIYKLINFKI